MLEYAVQSYRSAVESSMNVNWFIYRKASYQELIAALKEKFENYQDVFWGVMHSIDTINTNNRKEFIKLLQNKGSSDFDKKGIIFKEIWSRDIPPILYYNPLQVVIPGLTTPDWRLRRTVIFSQAGKPTVLTVRMIAHPL